MRGDGVEMGVEMGVDGASEAVRDDCDLGMVRRAPPLLAGCGASRR